METKSEVMSSQATETWSQESWGSLQGNKALLTPGFWSPGSGTVRGYISALIHQICGR